MVIEKLLLVNYRLCRRRIVVVMLLLVDHRLCGYSVMLEMLLLESFGLCKCNGLTSVCYRCSSLSFEAVEAWCTDNTRTSG